MSRTPYDQASRSLARRGGLAFIAWLLGLAPDELSFEGWLDTRRLPWPGQPERTGDTVAFLRDLSAGGVPWAVVIEFQLTPDGLMFGRLLVYQGQLWLEMKPYPERGDRFSVGAVVVNLTGQGRASQDQHWPRAGLRSHLEVVERNLEGLDAGAVLDGVAAGQVPRTVLALVPLMQNGGEDAIIQRWLALASAEPDAGRRADLGLARVLAQAAGRQDVWKQALRGWNVIESEAVREWQAEARAEGKAEGKVEGKAEGRAEALLEFLEARFGSVPSDLAARVRAATDLDLLKGWTSLAARAVDLIQFRQAAQV
jgi:hypothetical protein